MRTLHQVLEDLFKDGLEIDAEDHGTSRKLGLYRTGTTINYATVWTFTIRYMGRQDTFEYNLSGEAEPRPNASKVFQTIFDDTAFEYDNIDFGMWAMHNGYNTAIQEDRMDIQQVWDHWQESQAVKKRLIELFTLNTFIDIVFCDKSEEEAE